MLYDACLYRRSGARSRAKRQEPCRLKSKLVVQQPARTLTTVGSIPLLLESALSRPWQQQRLGELSCRDLPVAQSSLKHAAGVLCLPGQCPNSLYFPPD